jgi:hypothetical protein
MKVGVGTALIVVGASAEVWGDGRLVGGHRAARRRRRPERVPDHHAEAALVPLRKTIFQIRSPVVQT